MDKERFLARVREALGPSKDRPSSSSPVPPASPMPDNDSETSPAQAVDLLAATASARGWNVHRSTNPEDAVSYITQLALSIGANMVLRSDEDLFSGLNLDWHLGEEGVITGVAARNDEVDDAGLRNLLSQADMCVTGADWIIAETGSVVAQPRTGLSRLVSLTPQVHVALVRPADVVPDLDSFFRIQKDLYQQGRWPPYTNFITGPSRTADIEQTLVIGVHGPKEVHMVILEWLWQ